MENNLPFNERIARILHDENFRRDCINDYRQNFFFKHLNLIKQIAFIDISQYRIDNHEFDATITEQDILDETLSFYADLDAICPKQPLLPTVLENQKYVTFKPNYNRLKPGEKPRSSCGFSWVKDEYGNNKLEREIFFDLEQNIKTRFAGPHEFAHSLSKAFEKGKPCADPLMAEFCPVIVDILSLEFFKNRHPEQAKMVERLKTEHMVQNVLKARTSLLEASVIQVMTGETTVTEVMQQYGSLFNPRMINNCLEQIEQNRFNPLYEARYVLSEVMATTLRDKMQVAPEEVVSSFKTVLSNDSEINFEQATEMLNLPPKEVMVDRYKQKLNPEKSR